MPDELIELNQCEVKGVQSWMPRWLTDSRPLEQLGVDDRR
jgi:hypothetical protein